MASISEELRDLQCPMNWDIAAIRKCVEINRLVGKFKEKLEEKENEEAWRALNILLFLSYENFESQDRIFDQTYLQHGEELIQSDPWLRKHHKAADHVFSSMRVHNFLKQGSRKLALKYNTHITPYKNMSNKDKAFVLAMKACFYMIYGPPGNEEASKILTEVLELERNEPEWYYLKGKCLARMRRPEYRMKPSVQEMELFKKAAEMDKRCPRYLVTLARSKADLALELRYNKTSTEDHRVLQALEVDLESILRKAAKMPLHSSHLYSHIARSFLKLSYIPRMRNMKVAHSCVKKALEMAPSDTRVNHVAGLYYLTEYDMDKAIFFLTEASNMGVYGASFDLCKLKWKECRGYDPVPDLMKILEQNDQFASDNAHGLLATYYLFVKDDLPSAVKHWKQWRHSRDKEETLTASIFLGKRTFDLNSVLYDEVRLELNSTRYTGLEDRLLFKEAVEIIKENRPELESVRPRRQRQHLVDEAQMVLGLGRIFPHSIGKLKNEQNIKLSTRVKDVRLRIKEVKKKTRKRIIVRQSSTKPTRSQSTSRIYEIRKDYQKRFRPQMNRRHASVENLGRGGSRRGGWSRGGSSRGGSSRGGSSRGGSSRGGSRTAGSGRGTPNFEPRYQSTSRNWRSESEESLTSNLSGKEWYGGRGASNMGTRTRSSEQFSRNSRRPSSDRESSPGSFRTPSPGQSSGVRTRQPNFEKDFSRASNMGARTRSFEQFSRNSRQLSSDRESSPGSFRAPSPGQSSGVHTGRPNLEKDFSRASNMGARTRSFEQFSRNSRQLSSDRESSPGSFRAPSPGQSSGVHTGRPSFERDFRRVRDSSQSENSGSDFESGRNWRRGENVGQDQASPKSSFFQSFSNENTRDSWRPQSRNNRGRGDHFETSSRSSSGNRDNPSTSAFSQSRNNRGRGDRFETSSHSSSGNRDNTLTSTFSQSRNNRGRGGGSGQQDQSRFGERSNYTPRGGGFSRGVPRGGSFSRGVPRGGSFIRGGQRDPRARECMESRDAIDEFERRK